MAACMYVGPVQEGVSALQLAAEGNHTACMELLLMAGAKVDLKNRVRAPVVPVYNHRSLDRTVRPGCKFLTYSFMLQYGWTALHRSAESGSQEGMALLIMHGADVDAKTAVRGCGT